MLSRKQKYVFSQCVHIVKSLNEKAKQEYWDIKSMKNIITVALK